MQIWAAHMHALISARSSAVALILALAGKVVIAS